MKELETNVIAALIIKAEPMNLERALNKLYEIEQCDIYFENTEGHIIATLETRNINELKQKLKILQDFPEICDVHLHCIVYSEKEFREYIGRTKAELRKN